MADHFQSDPIDENDATYPSSIEQCKFCGDPSTDRVANDRDVKDLQLVQ